MGKTPAGNQMEFWEKYESDSIDMHIKYAEKYSNQRTQVVGCRIPTDIWHLFEVKCINNQQTMSNVMRSAIETYIRNN